MFNLFNVTLSMPFDSSLLLLALLAIVSNSKAAVDTIKLSGFIIVLYSATKPLVRVCLWMAIVVINMFLSYSFDISLFSVLEAETGSDEESPLSSRSPSPVSMEGRGSSASSRSPSPSLEVWLDLPSSRCISPVISESCTIEPESFVNKVTEMKNNLDIQKSELNRQKEQLVQVRSIYTGICKSIDQRSPSDIKAIESYTNVYGDRSEEYIKQDSYNNILKTKARARDL